MKGCRVKILNASTPSYLERLINDFLRLTSSIEVLNIQYTSDVYPTEAEVIEGTGIAASGYQIMYSAMIIYREVAY